MFHHERLRAFVCFADQLNLTRAAKMLHTSQPALYAQLRGLAEEVGYPLYVKNGRQLELTQEGQRLAAFGREMMVRADNLRREFAGGQATFPVRVAAGAGAYQYLLGPALGKFLGQAPLELITRDAPGVLEALHRGEAELGVAVVDGPVRQLNVEKLTRVEMGLVLPRNHPLANKPRIRSTDLQDQVWVVPPSPRPHRAMIARVFSESDLRWRVAVEASSWELMVHFVALGFGLAVVNGCVRVPPQLVIRRVPFFPPVDYALIHRKRVSEGAEKLLALIRQHAEDWRVPLD